jgi:hypothetical protein
MADGRSVEIPGTRRRVASFVENVITNTGLDHIGNRANYSQYCHVGTGNAAESASDTALDTFLASVSAGFIEHTRWAQASPPYYGASQQRWRFAANFGGGNVNISEVGCSNQLATGNLFSRALVKDGGGSPTVVPVLSTEYLDVFYTLRIYPDHVNYTTGALDDGAGSITIGGVSYAYTIRCMEVDNVSYWGRNIFSGCSFWSLPNNFIDLWVAPAGVALGAVTGTMTGATITSVSLGGTGGFQTYGTYVNSTYTQTLNYGFGLENGNISGGIRGIMIPSNIGSYQILLAASIPKDVTKLMTWVQRHTWNRKAL